MANIKNCLKKKNRILGMMDTEFTKASRYNSISEKNRRPYSVFDSLKNYEDLAMELVELKTKLHEANVKGGMLKKIFLLSELKTQAHKLQNLDCSEGVVSSRYDSTETLKTAELTVETRDTLVLVLQDRIEAIEEELDRFNHETVIEGV
ncbi:MAG: hypothetical protein RL416_520 [Pseudomonadota bacterium]|jgi:hypothetical protein